MNLLKKWWDFLFGEQEEPVVLEEAAAEEVQEEVQTVQHCESHIRFKKSCPDCFRAVGIM